MIRVGLTGGIGSGKSTVAQRFSELGALVIDADAIAREVVEPGQSALAEIVDAFGADMLQTSGELDRAALAAIVFNDPDALARLNAITHPRVAERTAALMAAAPADAVVVYDVPLLVENNLVEGWDAIVVVQAPQDVRVQRLRDRGVGASNIAQRMAAQASDQQRRAVADIVIDNGGDLATLLAQVDAAWLQITKSAGGDLP